MEVAFLICLLCLQACLLTDGQPNSKDTSTSVLTKDQDGVMSESRLRRDTSLSQIGAVSARGMPNVLLQADRSRRHLSGNKRKVKRKSRVGSFSLLSHNNPTFPLQVTRVKRDEQQKRVS
ncbi:uncharacterized protein si:dkey-12l12.1 isoform X2 [Engraulis encrasicolus]|uniref:uncharacterized protein si:dkey-12l12.1 isoform X2 n=1 Tax=Engraulis encrasicolus TaxID=184585 RepID=UPI002FD63AF5